MADGSVLARRFAALGQRSPLFYDEPLQVTRAEGVWLYDATGRAYLDAYNNVPHVGHCHPRVVDALCRQASRLNTHTRYVDESVVSYAEQLLREFEPPLSRLFFTCTGSESNELALRIARECTGHQGVITTSHAYHGNTAAVAEISSAFTPIGKRGPRTRTVPVIDPYRERGSQSDAELTAAYLEDARRAIVDLQDRGIGLAAILFCTALSSEGLPALPAGYLQGLAELAHAAGGLFIADEVQAGFGRLGASMWGYALHGVRPDVVTLGKPMGNGHPLGAVITTPELMEEFSRQTMYFNTFAGNQVSCAAGMAVLDVLREEGLLENARTVGNDLRRRLGSLQQKWPSIGDVRGHGLFIGVDIIDAGNALRNAAPAMARNIVNAMREEGVLVSRTGPCDNVLKIRPPMPFSVANAEQLTQTLESVLKRLHH
jgi:4-aminobutyrate aminotransferase-like enzyme